MIVSLLFFSAFCLSLLVEFTTTRPVRYQAGSLGPIKVNAALESHRNGVCTPGMSQRLGYPCEDLLKSQDLVVFASERSHALMPSMVSPASETPSYVEGPLGLYDSSRLHSGDLPKPQKPPVVASERSDRLMQNVAFCTSEMPSCEDVNSAVDESSQVHAEHSIKARVLASEGNEDTPHQPHLSTPLFIFPRTVIQTSSNDVTTPVSPAHQLPMFASFAPLLSYSSIVLFIAFVVSRLQRWFSRRRRRQGSLGLDGVELLPTTTASVLPEFRDYIVQPPNVPPTVSSPGRLGRRIEAHKSIDALGAVGTRLKKPFRSQSLSLPKAETSGLHAPVQFRSFASEPRSKSTPNTPNGLLVDLSPTHDWNARNGIHARRPFVNDVLLGNTSLWAADVNVSSDTLFGLRQTLSNQSVDIADVPLKPIVMKSRVSAAPVEVITVAVPVAAFGAKATSPSLSDSYSEQDITVVQSNSDHPLIEFSPKGGSALDLTAAAPVVDDTHEIGARDEVTSLPHSSLQEKPLMEFSQWDEEGWGFEVVSLPSVDDECMGITKMSTVTREEESVYEVAEHSVQKPLLPSPVQNSTDVHAEYSVQDITVISSPLHADEKIISADEDAKPDTAEGTVVVLLRESVEDTLVSSAAENLWTAAVLDEGAPVVQRSLDAKSSEASEAVELQDTSDNSDPYSDFDDALTWNQPTPPVLVEPPTTIDIDEQHDNYDIYDNSDDNKDPFHHSYDALAEPQRSESLAVDTIILSLPLEVECPSPDAQLMPDIPPSESPEMDTSIDDALVSQPEMNAPALSPVAVLDSSSASPQTCIAVDSVSIVQRSPELLDLEDTTTDVSIPELVIDQHDLSTATKEFPDPELIPLPISPKERDSSLLVYRTPTSLTPLPLSPVRKSPARPAWSLRAADAPPLGLSASASAVGLPSLIEEEEKVKSEVENAKDSSPVPPSSSASSMTLSSSLPGAFPEPEAKETAIAVSPSKEVEVRSTPSRPRVTRSPIDIALAMQLRPGLGVGADPAWMVRFLMSMFGWFVVMLSGSGGSDGYYYPIRR
ncbi:uncharacterized protein BT62DRAFT_1072071 [Guyanagaster necrorhizus]|uniref:Transmembrane protein n=1 Tax=Guyanagaster necrorhizus TaxID=856835 RepID=A0A9P7W3J2_9AGAR|nr:uncharacterized protein BT62DRAFT_1072071 [Guyanagaster necrorhizus MCA 3950]KAG7451512.1 hypothetical protein BT62DRAFT_1072071 [Guyanagaster necrorhizus MCA 3950]